MSVDKAAQRIIELEGRLEEAEQLIEAIKAGEVDAFALNKNNKHEVFTLESGDYGYRMLVENFNQGAVTLSEDGLIVYTNGYFHKLLELTYDSTIGKSVFAFLHPGSRETFSELFKKGLAGQSSGEVNLTSGDRVIPVYVTLTSLYPKLATVGVIVTDLTEKKRQDEILERHKALELEKRLLEESGKAIQRVMEFDEAVMASMTEGLYTVDVNGLVTSLNPSAEKMFGWKKEELLGKKMHDVTHHTHRDGSPFPAHECAGLKVLTDGVALNNYEDVFIRKDGTFFDVMYSLAPIMRGGKREGLIVVFRDITEEKESERKLAESQEQLRLLTVSLEEKVQARTSELLQKTLALEKMNKELEAFAYISSHDLQEPLRKIQTFVTRILDKEHEHLSAHGKDMFQRMVLAAKTMQTLIGDLLAYSRTSNLEKNFEKTDLNLIMKEVMRELKEEIEESKATIEVGTLYDAYIIPFQFRQMMNNLIGNSLKFSREEAAPQIKITGAIIPSYGPFGCRPACYISVADNGIGFEKQYSERIFEVFQRLNPKSNYRGTGIGLSIVRKIVENHHGHITAHSTPGTGATFEIYFPADDHSTKSY